MDSRWYLFHGQTIENTKISDRAHALHITKTNWDAITKHLDRKKILQEMVDKEAAIKRYLDEGSKNMTKSWENSLENVRKRKEEERLKSIEQKKDERQKRFLSLRKEQEEIRAKYMDKVKKQIFMTTGHARDLTSALVTSEVLFERQKQQEFMKKIKEHEKEEDLAYLEYQQKKAEQEIAEENVKKQLLKEKEKLHMEELVKIVEEKATLEKQLKEERVKKEALDNIEAVKEMEKLDKMLIEDKLKKKKELAEDKKKFLKQQVELKAIKAKEEKELDEVIEIYKEAKHKIDCMKKLREKELREAEVKRREKIAAMVTAEQQNRSEAENRSIQKALMEKDAAELEKIKARQEFDKKMREERLKNREEVLAIEHERQIKNNELKKWELINRYKTVDVMNKYEENKKRELWEDILKYRQELCEQMADHRAEQRREKEIDDAMAAFLLQDEDTKFFEYADEVMEVAQKKGRCTLPIEKVISKYCKEMNIKSEKCNKYNNPEDENNKKNPKVANIKTKYGRLNKKVCKCAHDK